MEQSRVMERIPGVQNIMESGPANANTARHLYILPWRSTSYYPRHDSTSYQRNPHLNTAQVSKHTKDTPPAELVAVRAQHLVIDAVARIVHLFCLVGLVRSRLLEISTALGNIHLRYPEATGL